MTSILILQVRDTLLPIYLNTSLDPEVRMAACYMLMDMRPPAAVLQMIAVHLAEEPNEQVASFSYSHLKTMAEMHGHYSQ